MVLRAENGYTQYTIYTRTQNGLAAAHTISGNHIQLSPHLVFVAYNKHKGYANAPYACEEQRTALFLTHKVLSRPGVCPVRQELREEDEQTI